jgi:hypothetical protein
MFNLLALKFLSRNYFNEDRAASLLVALPHFLLLGLDITKCPATSPCMADCGTSRSKQMGDCK